MNEPKDKPKETETTDTDNPLPEEVGGSDKPEPTRYGDWEVDGRCTDF